MQKAQSSASQVKDPQLEGDVKNLCITAACECGAQC